MINRLIGLGNITLNFAAWFGIGTLFLWIGNRWTFDSNDLGAWVAYIFEATLFSAAVNIAINFVYGHLNTSLYRIIIGKTRWKVNFNSVIALKPDLSLKDGVIYIMADKYLIRVNPETRKAVMIDMTKDIDIALELQDIFYENLETDM